MKKIMLIGILFCFILLILQNSSAIDTFRVSDSNIRRLGETNGRSYFYSDEGVLELVVDVKNRSRSSEDFAINYKIYDKGETLVIDNTGASTAIGARTTAQAIITPLETTNNLGSGEFKLVVEVLSGGGSVDDDRSNNIQNVPFTIIKKEGALTIPDNNIFVISLIGFLTVIIISFKKKGEN